jgi:hypothetical protein
MKVMKKFAGLIVAVAGLALGSLPAVAQIRTVDPNTANADLAPVPPSEAQYGTTMASPSASAAPTSQPASSSTAGSGQPESSGPAETPPANANATAVATGSPPDAGATYHQDDLISAAEGVFGRGAEGLAKMIQNILKDQGEPNAYIAGREAGGAIAVGLRYGSGTLFHKVEGNQPVYWTGPSLGFDLGANGSKTFMLVYNLYNSEDLYKRFPGGEGVIYLVGGFNASYQRRGDVVIIPIRLGVGWRLGANVGYLKFGHKSQIMPF